MITSSKNKITKSACGKSRPVVRNMKKMKLTLWTLTIIGLTNILITSCGTDQGDTERTPEKIEFPTVDYAISPTADTTLFGPQGTRIFIGSGSFRFADGSSATDSIKIELKEFYNKSDIILSNLSTSSGDRLLETAGMIQIDASSSGQKLEIQEDKRIVIHFPKKRNDYRKMNLFHADDNATDSSVTSWEVDTTKLTKKTLELGSYGWYWPSQDDSTDYSFIPKNYVDTGYYWNPIDLYVNAYDFSEQAKREIESNVYQEGVEVQTDNNRIGVECLMHITKNGRITKATVNSNVSNNVKEELLSFLKNLPLLEPGKNKHGDIIERRGFLHITGGNVVPLYNTDAEYIQSFDSKYSQFERTPIRNMDDAELNYYIFSVSKLGWINCDRFIDTEENINMLVQTPVDANTKIKMAFSDIDGVLMADIIDGKYVFSNVPKGREVTIIGIRNDNGLFSTAFKETTITDRPLDYLSFTEITLAHLREKLEKI